jgi:hypothetical protein
MFQSAPTATSAAVFEPLEVAVDGLYRVLTVDSGHRLVKSVMVNSSGDHMSRGRSIVAAGIAVDSLPFIAAMVDAFFAPMRPSANM